MTQVNKRKIVENWLSELDDRWIFIKAQQDEGVEITADQVKELALECDRIEIDDQGDLPLAKQGNLYSKSLVFIKGNALKAFQNQPGHKVYFVNAYLREYIYAV